MRIPGRRLGYDELTFLHRQLASMARLNLPFVQGLGPLAEETEHRDFGRLVRAMLADLEEGKTLSQALAARKGVFSDLYVGVVQAGERSGDLASALEGLANYSESMLFLRQRVRATLAYPTVALAISLGMIAFVFSTLVPRFQTIYATLDIPLPGLTSFYIGLSTALREHFELVLLGAAGLAVVVLVLRRIGASARAIRQLALNLPFYGKLFRQVLLLRFCETLRALLRSNVSLVPALDLTAKTLGDNTIRLTVEDMRTAAEEGRRTSDILKRNSFFPRTFVWKFALAEEQGNLEATLGELSHFADVELRSVTARFSSLLEPFLIAIVGVVVGSLVLSVFLPIFKFHGFLV